MSLLFHESISSTGSSLDMSSSVQSVQALAIVDEHAVTARLLL